MARAPRIPGWPQNDLLEKEYWEKHPGFAESMVPVWGSAREAVADYHDGDYLGMVGNGALAASDVLLAGAATRGVAKGLTKGAVEGALLLKRKGYGFRGISRDLHKTESGFAKAGEEVHHWLLHQNEGLGKYVPDYIKNQPWNLKALPRDVHQRIHRAWKGEQRFGPLERYHHGVPTGAKIVQGVAVGHAGAGAKARWEDDE